MLVGDSHRLKHLSINSVVVKVNHIHLLADALQSSLRAKSRQICTHETMSFAGHLLKVNVIRELHVLGVNAQAFHAARLVRHADVDLAVETTEATQGWVDGVRTIRSRHDYNVCARFETVHESEELRNNTTLYFAIDFVTLRGDGIDLVDEDDRWRVLLGLSKGFAQIVLRLSGHLRHDFGAVNKEEKGTSLVGYRARNQGLARARRAKHEHTPGRLDAKRLEKTWVSQRKLDNLADLCKLLAYTTNIVIANVIQTVLVVALDGLALTKNHRVGCNDAKVSWINLDDLELNGAHTTTNKEEIVLAHGAVGLKEIGLEESLEKVASDTLNGIIDRKHVDALAILDVGARLHVDHVAQTHLEILADDLVHANLGLLACVVGKHDAYRILALFALDLDGVSAEKLKGGHGVEMERDNRVVVIHGIVHDKTVGVLFLQRLCLAAIAAGSSCGRRHVNVCV
mmetsp:Transcript_34560/g.55751  ORF Transcript_34560/g.55751 Transcript_34560/m.55751 type:complete len:456 (-) Transcript_34560:86-1453(-)